MEHDGGLARAEAEELAAGAVGMFGDPGGLALDVELEAETEAKLRASAMRLRERPAASICRRVRPTPS
ncbi:hypothetical protein HOI71_18880 [Candidatus Poribacteria bacterium]|nr:hypothetical protein [Candidatus Poribacteria bacterium]